MIISSDDLSNNSIKKGSGGSSARYETEQSGGKKQTSVANDPRISEPLKYEQTLSVRFNQQLNLFEGLPKVWREILEMAP